MWYGLSAWRLNDRPFAMEKLKKAATLNPDDPTIKEALALAEKGVAMKFEREKDEPAAAAAAGKTEPGKTPGKGKPVFVRVEDE